MAKMGAVNARVVFNCSRNGQGTNGLAVWISENVSEPTEIDALWAIIRIPDDLVDEVPQMQHELEPLVFGCALVFKDHATVRVLFAQVGILTRDKCKPCRARVVIQG